MKRIISVYGLIAGAIVSILMTIGIVMSAENPGAGPFGMVWGYATMLLAFCFIFIAIKTYRDKHLGGTISFGKAFLTGFWVAVIASVCYTITWVILYKGFYPGYLDEMFARELATMQRSGKSPAVIAETTKKMNEMRAMYATWPGLIGFTLLEILPLGILVSLVSALILKRREKRFDTVVQPA